MCCVSFHRLCLGHHISCALLQIPHVCCQTAHAHDGSLLRDTGRTSYKWTNSSKKKVTSKKSAVLWEAFSFSICNRVYFCRRKHNRLFFPVFAQLLFSWSEMNPPTLTWVVLQREWHLKFADAKIFLTHFGKKLCKLCHLSGPSFNSDTTK